MLKHYFTKKKILVISRYILENTHCAFLINKLAPQSLLIQKIFTQSSCTPQPCTRFLVIYPEKPAIFTIFNDIPFISKDHLRR